MKYEQYQGGEAPLKTQMKMKGGITPLEQKQEIELKGGEAPLKTDVKVGGASFKKKLSIKKN